MTDAFSSRIVGCQTADHLRTDLPYEINYYTQISTRLGSVRGAAGV